MRKVVTNSTYTFTPETHGIFNQVKVDKKIKIMVIGKGVKK
jgi:hypothetical protein